MPDVSFTNLLVVAAVAVLAPLAVGFFPRLRIPAVVLEIIGGIIIGPSVLGWVHVDLPVQILAMDTVSSFIDIPQATDNYVIQGLTVSLDISYLDRKSVV